MFLTLKETEYANLLIEPDFDLERTAHLLGELFGVITIVEDDGHYEEFPAFIGKDDESGFQFAILGVPEPEYDVRDEPHPYYQLIVEPICDGDEAYTVDASAQVADFLNASGRLRTAVP